MTTVKHALSEHDTVELRESVGAWPAGTCGAVISVYDDAVLVEIIGPDGAMRDMISVSAQRLSIHNG